MSRLEFETDLPDQNRPDWDALKKELKPGKTVLQRITSLPGGALIPAVLIVAVVDSVDYYKTDWAMLPAQVRSNITDANRRMRSAQIADAVRQTTGLKQLRSQGTSIVDIVFMTVGPTTVVRVQRATPSVVLTATVDGTDGYHGVLSLPTDAAGQISFTIPPPKQRPVLDRIVVSTGDSVPAGSSAISSRTSFVW